jgi:hypothetical protein
MYKILIALVLFGLIVSGCGRDEEHEPHLKSPGDPEIYSHGAGVLDSTVIRPRDSDVAAFDQNGDGRVFQCPMHWEVIAETPGDCPICRMRLVEYSVEQAQKNLDDYPKTSVEQNPGR